MEDTAEVVDSPQSTDLADVSTDDLRQQLATQPEAPAEEVQAVEGEPQQPETTEEVVEENSTEEVEVESSAETEEERLAKRRVRPRNELDQQVIDLYRSEGFNGSFQDASRVIYGQTQESAPQQTPQAEATQPDPFAGYDAVEGKLNDEITRLEQEVVKAADELETSRALELQRAIMKRELELQSVKDRKQRQIEKESEAHQNTQRSKALESRDKAVEAYPELGDKNSVYRKEFDDFVAKASENPDYGPIFQSPNWCEVMADNFARQKGYQPAPVPQAPQAPQQQAPATGTQTKVLTTGNTAQPINAPVTPERVRSDMGQMSNEDLYALLGQGDNRKVLR